MQARVERHHERVDRVLDVERGRGVAQQDGEVRAVGGVRAAQRGALRRSRSSAASAPRRRRAARCARGRTRAAARAAGAPGPSGGAPRSSCSCSARWRSPSSANVSPARSPKRRYIVPIPTPAACATSCIETQSGPRSANSSVAASRMRLRFEAASARSVCSAGSSISGSSSMLGASCRLRELRGAHARATSSRTMLAERGAQAGVEQRAVGRPRVVRLPDRQLALEHVARRSSPAPCAPRPAPTPRRTGRCSRRRRRPACRAAGSSRAGARPSRARS